MSRALDLVTSFAATVARLGSGMQVTGARRQPAKLLELYEFEACPFCRKVREALSHLDLDAMIYPCPKGGPRYREEVRRRGGRAMFPWLVDPNAGVEMYESDDIVRYLANTYGDGSVPPLLALPLVKDATSMLASALRPTRGGTYQASRPPAQPLELWSFEASPYCRLPREALSSLEIPYILHNVAKGSAKRDAFVQRSGKMQVPYLVDPNTGVAMFESGEIVRYLQRTYGEVAA